jgi:uncharacterized membrane protein
MVGGALVIAGLRRQSLLGDALMLGGGWLISAGITGRFRPYAAMGLIRADQDSSRGLIVERAITIGRPRETVFTYWRDLSHLSGVMRNVLSVTPGSGNGRRSHWVAVAPLGLKVEWDAEIVEERANELLAWQSLPGARIQHSGEVRFLDAPGNRGTEVRPRFTYKSPLGTAGAAMARLFGLEPTQQIDQGLRSLKAILESGEAPTTAGQPRGKPGAGQGRTQATALREGAR